MTEWKDFTEELPEVGEVIEWNHHQAYFCGGNVPKPDIETVKFSDEVEWIEGDLWRDK